MPYNYVQTKNYKKIKSIFLKWNRKYCLDYNQAFTNESNFSVK